MADQPPADRTKTWAIALAVIGILLIGLSGFLAARDRLGGNEAGACAAGTAAPPVDPNPAIISVAGGRDSASRPLLQLGKPLCVTIANLKATAPETLDGEIAALNGEVRATSAQIAQARREMSAAAGDARKAADQKVKDLQPLLDEQRARLDEARQAKAAASQDVELALFLNGKETPARAMAQPIPGVQVVRFELEPANDAESAEAVSWRRHLGGIPHGGKREVAIGIGAPGSARPIAIWAPSAKEGAAQLRVFGPGAAWSAGGGFLLLLVAIFVAGQKSALLRDGETADSAYSLGRVQMAFWMIATAFGYVFIWVLSGQYINVVTSATFTLIGITGATAIASKAIDASTEAPDSKGFFLDILSDGVGGPKLHRIQVAMWTLILGAIFIWNILDKLILTDFDANLLILIGIANGVYAGFKMQE